MSAEVEERQGNACDCALSGLLYQSERCCLRQRLPQGASPPASEAIGAADMRVESGIDMASKESYLSESEFEKV